MAQGTTTPQVYRDKWTQVTTVLASGLLQNTTGQRIVVREQTADPTASVYGGIIYKDEQGDVFASTPGLWVRLDKSSGHTNAIATVAVVEY